MEDRYQNQFPGCSNQYYTTSSIFPDENVFHANIKFMKHVFARVF